jgi:ATP adenylyltransferase
MTKPLWAPWRLEYIQQADELEGCIFCAEAAGEVPAEESLLVRRSDVAIVILNKFPYSSGHLMVAPRRHLASLEELSDAEALGLHRFSVESVAALHRAYRPDGFNLGCNLGHVAGAGIADHIHLHVVPRWSGDTNFMPILADVRVLPEHLLVTRDRLRETWSTG